MKILTLEEEIENLREENLKLRLRAKNKGEERVTKDAMRVSKKGAVSVYGLGRFPVSLYATQWRAVLEAKELILEFLEENAGELSVKPSNSDL